MAGGAKSYWEKSCPKCGKPSDPTGRIAENKVDGNTKPNKKVKCKRCNTPLWTI